VIAVDTSSLIDWFAGHDTRQAVLIDQALDDETLCLPPPVEAELLSFPGERPVLAEVLSRLPRLEMHEDVWRRTGLARRRLHALGLKAAFSDALIAQCCIDADTPLITRDRDFRHYAAHCGLRLVE